MTALFLGDFDGFSFEQIPFFSAIVGLKMSFLWTRLYGFIQEVAVSSSAMLVFAVVRAFLNWVISHTKNCAALTIKRLLLESVYSKTLLIQKVHLDR